MPWLTVIRGGMLTTVQDLGRWGHQHVGVPVAGPMDWYSHRLANRLVGNPDESAALEITLHGPDLRTDADIVCSITGGNFDAAISNVSIQPNTAFLLPRGQTLRIRGRSRGARGSVGIRGGIDVPRVLGSSATSLISRMGPFGGRALSVGDVLHVGSDDGPGHPPGRPLRLPDGGARLRVIRGPHESRFAAEAVSAFYGTRFSITAESNRMGYRLDGAVLARADAAEMLSDATPVGSVQVPLSGLPILLMADRQTTGGYPKIATVITADLPLAGQLLPGDWIEFVPCTRDAAVDALRRRDAALSGTVVSETRREGPPGIAERS
jgi:antagonist of KipI